jgi:uncharacterized protein
VRVRIAWPNDEVTAELADTPTTAALMDLLPVEGAVNTWGEEAYFSVPLSVDLDEDACEVVAPGTVCFWVAGSALALPYGPTPISDGEECRLASACNILGAVDGDPGRLASIKGGDRIRVESVG